MSSEDNCTLLHGSHGEEGRGIDLHAMSNLRAEGMTIGVVSGKWNACVNECLVQGIKEAVEPAGGKIIEEQVGGSFELPLAAQAMIKHVDAVICVGTLVKGETNHFEYLSQAISKGIMEVQLKFNKPVLFGVLPVLNLEQAKARCGLTCKENYGLEWGKSAIHSVELMRKYQ